MSSHRDHADPKVIFAEIRQLVMRHDRRINKKLREEANVINEYLHTQKRGGFADFYAKKKPGIRCIVGNPISFTPLLGSFVTAIPCGLN